VGETHDQRPFAGGYPFATGYPISIYILPLVFVANQQRIRGIGRVDNGPWHGDFLLVYLYSLSFSKNILDCKLNSRVYLKKGNFK
jgi:hypothetical protein